MTGDAGHRPVLMNEVLELLKPSQRRILVDCTVGLGGHAEAMLNSASEQALLIGMDVDECNLKVARRRLDGFGRRVRLFHANFDQLSEVLEQAEVAKPDLILADLGVCSTQLDDPMRGLSFQGDGPLDMRLDNRIRRTAADLVNRMGEKELADLIYQYGEDRFSRRIARAIVSARREKPLATTRMLADVVMRAYPAQAHRERRGVHPATRTFQALRIAVNDELGCLERLLQNLPRALTAGGVAGIISFHSLEDRLVKQGFASWSGSGEAKLLNRKPIGPAETEVADNPRSRSAKLRGIEKLT